MQTGQHVANVGSRLKRVKARKAPSEKPAFQPYRGKPAVRMIGGIEETSASYEARSAPRSYPTGGGRPPPATRWDGKRSVAEWPKLPRPSSTLPFETCRRAVTMSVYRGRAEVGGTQPNRREGPRADF